MKVCSLSVLSSLLACSLLLSRLLLLLLRVSSAAWTLRTVAAASSRICCFDGLSTPASWGRISLRLSKLTLRSDLRCLSSRLWTCLASQSFSDLSLRFLAAARAVSLSLLLLSASLSSLDSLSVVPLICGLLCFKTDLYLLSSLSDLLSVFSLIFSCDARLWWYLDVTHLECWIWQQLSLFSLGQSSLLSLVAKAILEIAGQGHWVSQSVSQSVSHTFQYHPWRHKNLEIPIFHN